MNYDVIVGIETHIQIKTKTKMFCSCSTNYWQAEPNTLTCPVCLGLPGALPVANKAAIDAALLMALALEGHVAEQAHFDRKNYFYPDLAKGYQISQYDQPFQLGGRVRLAGASVGLIRAHLEEDVGKLTHDGNQSLVDFNKAGVPLLEIVSEPTMHSSAEAKQYVQALHQLAKYLGLNEGNLERGELRADVNISLQKPGQWQWTDGQLRSVTEHPLNHRVEIKNLNSFRAIERAIEFEIDRQARLLDQGEAIRQETRGWNEDVGQTQGQRGKEEAHDYRYFPEPDLPPIVIDQRWLAELKQGLPELPMAKLERFQSDYGLSQYHASLLTEDRRLADWYEQAVRVYAESEDIAVAAKKVANWLLGDIARLVNQQQRPVVQSDLTPEILIDLIKLVDQATITAANAKEILPELFLHGGNPRQLVTERGWQQVNSAADLEQIAQQVIDGQPDAVANFRAGKASALQFLVGQMMKATKGQAHPQTAAEVLTKLLS